MCSLLDGRVKLLVRTTILRYGCYGSIPWRSYWLSAVACGDFFLMGLLIKTIGYGCKSSSDCQTSRDV